MEKKIKKNKSTTDAAKKLQMLADKLNVQVMGASPKNVKITCRSGSIALNEALGVGGYPEGRIIEIFGNESSGKTTLALHAIAEAQKDSKNVLFIDAEHALDPEYAKKIGCDIDSMLIHQPDSGEDALDTALAAVKSNQIDIIVVDSVAALTPKAELDGDMGDSHMGLHARLMSQALRKMTGEISKSKCLIIFINQMRMKIGVVFGNPETTTGGNALKFYASQRIEVRKSTQLKNGDEVYGNEVKVKVIKNKVAPPFKTAKFTILYNVGIDSFGELLDLAVDCGVVQKSGAWYAYNNEKIGQGRANAISILKENNDLETKIREGIKTTIDPERLKAMGI